MGVQSPAASLPAAFGAALRSGEAELARVGALRAASRAERFATLGQIYRLLTGPLGECDTYARRVTHPAVSALKYRLEREWLDELRAQTEAIETDTGEPVETIRRLAAQTRLPRTYRWVAREAGAAELRTFLEFEGGPDHGFDDLVAACQVGLSDAPKLELARNYWDELGAGDPAGTHRLLHTNMANALGLLPRPDAQRGAAELQRAALGGLLATNHWLQPEMLGALAVIELQAGPRCRCVIAAFDRLGAPAAAYPFYQVHAEVDPRHGVDWLAHAVAPLASRFPSWGPRMVRGAWWRICVDRSFFAEVESALVRRAPRRAAA